MRGVTDDPDVSEWRQQRPADRARGVSSGAAGRIAGIVDALIADAGADGERAVAWVRLGIAAAACVLWVPAALPYLARGLPQDWAVAASIVLVAGWSGLVLWVLPRRRAARASTMALRLTSIVVDVVVVLGLLAAFVAFPAERSTGLVHVTGMALVYLGIVVAGTRLSRRGVVLALAISALGLGALLVTDVVLHGASAAGNVPEYASVALLVAGSGLVAFFNASRARRLVLDAANQAVLADRARSRLGSYVSDDVAREVMKTDEVRLEGRRSEMAILFTDLRGFTSYSEALPPEALFGELNDYLRVMVEVLHAHGAYVDKFIGDAVMAVFGVPDTRGDDAARALRAVAALQLALARHNRDRARRDLPPLVHGVGAHWGVAVQGNVGTAGKANYTVIGDAVNLASRLESATKEQGVAVLVSRELVEAARRAGVDGLPEVTAAGTIMVKGRAQPVEVLTLAAAEQGVEPTAGLEPATC